MVLKSFSLRAENKISPSDFGSFVLDLGTREKDADVSTVKTLI